MIEKIVKTIRKERRRKGISQEEICSAIGIKQGYLSDVELGKKIPSMDLVIKICDFLDLNISHILAEMKFKGLEEKIKKGEFFKLREIDIVLDAISGAKKSLDIMGINNLGPLHQGREMLIRLLNNGGHVRICLLDVNSEGFKQRERDECQHQITGKISPRLRDEYKASIGILKDINQFKKAGTLEVRQYKHYPLCSIIISDGKLLQYNPCHSFFLPSSPNM